MKKLLLLPILLYAQPAWSARPFVTDDARLTNAESCQFESWTRIYPNSTEAWALPACNPTGNFEVTLGSGLSMANATKDVADYVIQAKILFKALETNGWGIGFAVGKVYHPAVTPSANQLGNTYAYIPFSTSFNDDKIVMHLNVGVLHDHASNKDSVTWGVGGEFKASPRLTGILEAYGDHQSSPFAQAGIRMSVVPNLFQVDATLGRQLNGMHDNQWLSFGVRMTPDKIF